MSMADIDICIDKDMLEVRCDVASVRGVTITTLSRNKHINKPTLDEYHFEPYIKVNETTDPIAASEHDINTSYSSKEGEVERNSIDLNKNLKILLEIAIENAFKQRLVIGINIETEQGVETLRQLFEIERAFSLIQFQFWALTTDAIERSQISEKFKGYARFLSSKDLTDSALQGTDLFVSEPGSIYDNVLSKITGQSMIMFQTNRSMTSKIANENELHNETAQVIARRDLSETTLMLLRSHRNTALTPHVIHIHNDDFEWVRKVKQKLNEIAENPNDRIWLIASQNNATGLVGFVNCMFQESKANKLR